MTHAPAPLVNGTAGLARVESPGQPHLSSRRPVIALRGIPCSLRPKVRVIVASCALASLLPAPVHAEPAGSDWQWGATVYLWLPSLDGDTAFPPEGGGPPIDVSADAVLESINSVFMAALEGRRGRWGVATDVVYLDLGASRRGTREVTVGPGDLPAGVDADLRLDVTGWLWTLTGSYAVLAQDNVSLDVLAGARLLELQEELHWTFNGDIASLPLTERSGSGRAEDGYWDAIVGLRGRATLGTGHNWFVPCYLDVGAGESDLTWQARIGLGYRFESVEVLGVWRHLDYDLGNGTPIQSLDLSGPAVGVTFRF